MKEKVWNSSFAVRFRMFLGLLLFLGGTAFSQTRYTPSELDTLVLTIALYPDPLLVHVLDATTHGDDLPNAYAFANAHRNLKGDDLAKSIEDADLGYDESVMALIPFPDVLKKLTKYATWANQLGEAVEMQKADVMDAVQRMRKVANKNGYLKSDENVTITVDDNVSIQPVRDEYVYVPEYDPRVVYYVASDGSFQLRYVNGTWIGAGLVYWGWDPFVYDWIHRRPHYRHPRRYMAPPPRRHHTRPTPRPRFDNPPPPPRTSNPPPSNRRQVAPPPPRSNSAWDRRSSETQSSNVLSKTAATAPSTQRANSSLERRPPAPPPPPSNYKRPVPPPPPQASSSDDDDYRNSRRAERHHGSHNSPPPLPSHRRR